MITLSFDPGTVITGWSIFENGKPKANGNFKMKQRLELSKRLGQLFLQTKQLIDEIHPDEIAIEEQHVGANRQTSLITARAMGIIIAVAGINDIPVVSYEPAVIKKTTTGKGNATKDVVADAIINQYGDYECIASIGPFKDKGVNKTDDIYDAIGINHTHNTLKKKATI